MKLHTVRKYTNQGIGQSVLKEIIEAAMQAPTTGNMQLYSVVITRDKEKKHQLAPCHFNQSMVEECDTVLTVCADFNRMVKWCQCRDADPYYDNLQSLTAAFLDATIFAQQIVTEAAERGIGCCYLGTTTYNPEDIARILSLPPRVVPVVTLTLGYPAEPPVEVGRLPYEAIAHDEAYKDYTPADIDRLFAEKEARQDSRRFVEENGKQTLAQVFTDVRYPRANNEAFSETLLDFLKKQYPFK